MFRDAPVTSGLLEMTGLPYRETTLKLRDPYNGFAALRFLRAECAKVYC